MAPNSSSTSPSAPAPAAKSGPATSFAFIAALILVIAAAIYLFKTNPATGCFGSLSHAHPPGSHLGRLRGRLRGLSHLLDYPAGDLSLPTHREDWEIRRIAGKPDQHHRR